MSRSDGWLSLDRATRITLTADWAPITAVVDGVPDFLSPTDLPVAIDLQLALSEWAARYNHELPTSQMREYHREGWVLARQLARQLDDQPPIYWYGAPALDAPAPR